MNLQIDKIKQSVFRFMHYVRDLTIVKKENSQTTGISVDLIKEYNKTRKYTHSKLICHAPFKSLYFTPEGEIFSCCYNRSHIFGTFPEQLIPELSQGASIGELRNALRADDLSMGCFSCLTQIGERTFSSVMARYFDDYPLRKYPSLMEFELSNVCNMACVMCDGRYSSVIRKEREKLPPIRNPYDDSFVHQLEEFIPHLSKAKFLGGEPFLINIYYDIWEKILEINHRCVISVQTNGSVLNDRIKRVMERGGFHITVSVDAVSKEVFDKIRIKGDFNKVMDNIRYFHAWSKRNNAWFGVVTCPMQQNWKEIPDIINYCNEMDTGITFNRVWQPLHCTLRSCSSDILKVIYDFYSTIRLPDKTAVQRQNRQQFIELKNQILQWSEQQKLREAQYSLFAGMDNDTLKRELLKKIGLHAEVLLPEDKEESSEQYVIEKAERVLMRFSDHKNYREMLYTLLEIPVTVLYNEFRKNSEEVLLVQAENYLKDYS